MPRIFHDAATQLVRERRRRQPIPEPNVVALGTLKNLPPRSTKLRTARHPNLLRHWFSRKQFHESGFEVLAGVDVIAMGIGEWVDLDRATEHPGTAQVHVALFLKVGDLELLEHRDAVVVGIVVVPLEALRMNEEHRIWEIVVVVDDIPRGLHLSDHVNSQEELNLSHVRYTIDSLPLFCFTVSGAFLSSTT